MSEQELLKKVGELNNTLEAGYVFGKEEAWERLQARMEQNRKPVYLRLPVRIAAVAALLLVLASVAIWYMPGAEHATAVITIPPIAPAAIETTEPTAMTTPRPITTVHREIATTEKVTHKHIDVAASPAKTSEPTINALPEPMPMAATSETVADSTHTLTIKEKLAMLPVMTANETEVNHTSRRVVQTNISTAETIKDMPIFMMNDGQAEVHTMPEKTVRFHSFFGKNMAANGRENPPNLTLSISLNH